MSGRAWMSRVQAFERHRDWQKHGGRSSTRLYDTVNWLRRLHERPGTATWACKTRATADPGALRAARNPDVCSVSRRRAPCVVPRNHVLGRRVPGEGQTAEYRVCTEYLV